MSSIINSEDENSRQGVTGGAVGGPPEFEEIEETQIEYIIQLQGSHVEIVHEYFKNLGIKDISIRG